MGEYERFFFQRSHQKKIVFVVGGGGDSGVGLFFANLNRITVRAEI